MSAVLTPRVRNLVICDGIRASRLEADVYHIRGARTHVFADSFPVRRRLHLYVTLSSPRPGRFPGCIKIINDRTDKAVFYGDIEPAPEFPDNETLMSLELPMQARFPEPGRYSVQLWFFQEAAPDILKMEQPLYVYAQEA